MLSVSFSSISSILPGSIKTVLEKEFAFSSVGMRLELGDLVLRVRLSTLPLGDLLLFLFESFFIS